MLQREMVEYYVYFINNNEKIFIASIITDSPHKARQLIWSKFEPEIKQKNSEAKINSLVAESLSDRIMLKTSKGF